MNRPESTGADAPRFLSVDRIVSALMDGSFDASLYPGRTGSERERTDVSVVAANWNHVPNSDRIQRILERRHGIEVDWTDSVYGCDDCGHAVGTVPEYWTWTPSYAWDGECAVVCFACLESRGLRWTEGPNGYRVVDPEDWRNRSISSGTMRPEDTVPAMVAALRELAFEVYDGKAFEEFGAFGQRSPRYLADHMLKGSDEDRAEAWEWLAEALSVAAPEGCYFGAHPDDGADLGFWEVDA